MGGERGGKGQRKRKAFWKKLGGMPRESEANAWDKRHSDGQGLLSCPRETEAASTLFFSAVKGRINA